MMASNCERQNIGINDLERNDRFIKLADQCIVPLIPPLVEIGGGFGLDEERLERLLGEFAESGVDAVFVRGNAGMFNKITPELSMQILDFVVAHKAGMKVFFGVSDADFNTELSLARYAEGRADAIVHLPFYNPTVDPFMQLERLRDASPLPVILYDNPAISGNSGMSEDFLRQVISRFPGYIAGVKASSDNFDVYLGMVKLQQETGIPVFMGNATLIDKAKQSAKANGLKFAGAVPVHANAEPFEHVNAIHDTNNPGDTLVEFTREYPSIEATIEFMIGIGILDPATLKCWRNNQRG